MSKVAVEIYEAKREILRYDLLQPVEGKNGQEQKITSVNCDTKEIMKEIVLKRKGLYQLDTYISGTDIAHVRLNWDPKNWRVVESGPIQNTNYVQYGRCRAFVSEDNVVIPWNVSISGLERTTKIDHIYEVIRFLDE